MLIIWQRYSFRKTNRSKGVFIISNLGFLIIIVISLIGVSISFILSKVNKNKEKIDKGLVFAYYKLTYRRKWIRTLWSIPFLILCLMVIYKYSEWSTNVFILFSGLCIVMIVVEFFYGFYKWSKYERNLKSR